MNKQSKILIAVVILLIIIGGIWFAQKGSSVSSSQEIVIGAPLSFSGAAAFDAESIKKGMDLAVEDLAKKGVKVRIAYEDDQTNPTKTVASVQKLYATEQHVDAMVGFTWGFLLDAAAKIAIDHNTTIYTPANTSEIVNTKSSFVFSGTAKNAKQDVPIEEWVRTMKAKKVAIIVDNTSWGDSHLEAFKTGITKGGATLVMTERLPVGAEKDGIPSAFAKAVANGADTILWTGYENAAGAVLVQKAQQQGSGIKILAATVILDGLAKNKTITIRTQDNFYYLRPQTSPVFGEKYKARYGVYPASYADSGYDGVMLLVDGISKKTSTQTLADYLHSGVTYKGYQTDYSFDKNGDIQSGQWVIEKVQN